MSSGPANQYEARNEARVAHYLTFPVLLLRAELADPTRWGTLLSRFQKVHLEERETVKKPMLRLWSMHYCYGKFSKAIFQIALGWQNTPTIFVCSVCNDLCPQPPSVGSCSTRSPPSPTEQDLKFRNRVSASIVHWYSLRLCFRDGIIRLFGRTLHEMGYWYATVDSWSCRRNGNLEKNGPGLEARAHGCRL